MKTNKTKTNSFTKFITFCVLALFLITNMIFFTSCDNGNSPNDNTNEEQNNNAPTDYCEICDGVQTENCGIVHTCSDENCVEYADKKIYKNGHTHDYCGDANCIGEDKTTNSDHKHTYPVKETDWFKTATISGENINVKYVDIDAVPGTNAKEIFNNIFNQYRTHLQSFDINNELSTVEFDLNNATEFDQLIGTINPNKENMCPYNGINDVCKPAIEKITQNISSNNNIIEKNLFMLYYKAIDNEAYRIGYGYDDINNNEAKAKYEETQNFLAQLNGNEILPFANKYFYNESGKLNPEVVKEFDTMIQTVATKLQNQGYQVTVDDLRNIINLSFTASSIQGAHDKSLSWTYINENGQLENAHHDSFDAGTSNCTGNEMVDVINGTELATAKLNKSIFSQDLGRELC